MVYKIFHGERYISGERSYEKIVKILEETGNILSNVNKENTFGLLHGIRLAGGTSSINLYSKDDTDKTLVATLDYPYGTDITFVRSGDEFEGVSLLSELFGREQETSSKFEEVLIFLGDVDASFKISSKVPLGAIIDIRSEQKPTDEFIEDGVTDGSATKYGVVEIFAVIEHAQEEYDSVFELHRTGGESRHRTWLY